MSTHRNDLPKISFLYDDDEIDIYLSTPDYNNWILLQIVGTQTRTECVFRDKYENKRI